MSYASTILVSLTPFTHLYKWNVYTVHISLYFAVNFPIVGSIKFIRSNLKCPHFFCPQLLIYEATDTVICWSASDDMSLIFFWAHIFNLHPLWCANIRLQLEKQCTTKRLSCQAAVTCQNRAGQNNRCRVGSLESAHHPSLLPSQFVNFETLN